MNSPSATDRASSPMLVRMREALRLVYVLESLVNPSRHYTGLTSDVASRLVWHNAGQSVHTAKFRPWQLLVCLQFVDERHAARFERYLKTGSGRAFARRHFASTQSGRTIDTNDR
jgi:putative endonuclease